MALSHPSHSGCCRAAHAAAALSFVLLPLLLSGCAQGIIGFPPPNQTWQSNGQGTVAAVRYQGWGLFLDSHSLEAGLTLGYLDKTYFFPGPSSTTTTNSSPLFQLPHPTASTARFLLIPLPETHPIKARPADLPTPIALHSATAGLSFEANPHRLAFRFGMHRRSALILDADRHQHLIWITTRAPPSSTTDTASQTRFHFITFTQEPRP